MSEPHDAVGAYVADALDGAERRSFEAHLAGCESCRQEVAEFSETAAELSRLAAVPPPPALRANILDAIRDLRPLPSTELATPTPPIARTPTVFGDSAPVAGVAEPAGEVPEGLPDELAVRRLRRDRSRRWLSAAVAAVAVVALALGGWVYGLTQQRQNQVAAQEAAAAQARAETELLSAPDARVVPVTLKNGTRASFVVSEELDRAMFVSSDLPDPGADRTYQLWIATGAGIRPDNLVPGGGRQVQFFRGSVEGAEGLAISIEPAGGSAQPTADQIQKLQPI
ncbi:MAG: anti-sigma factor domain-containing protein [Actinomycetes bacterium]